MTKVIQSRSKVLHLNDPRCYNGAFYDAEYVWGPWQVLAYLRESDTEEKIEEKLKFWRDLSAYAVRARGESARSQYRVFTLED